MLILKKNAFSNSALESANLPKNAVLMEISVFSFCKSLTSAKIYSGTYLPASTFNSCEKLIDVTLNDEMEEIQQSVFFSCTIKNLDFLPSKIKIIGKSAFTGCPLEEIRYPKGLQSAEEIFIKK